jgi:hypothetical protein
MVLAPEPGRQERMPLALLIVEERNGIVIVFPYIESEVPDDEVRR